MKYKVVNGSESGHCCFQATVISVEAGGTKDTICECFSSVIAEMICEALNKKEGSKNHDQ